jgi:hypothetical protein
MALNASIHWGLILRVNVSQSISQIGWKNILAEARQPFNFDGEIFGMHSTMANQLREYGFKGEEAGLEADFVDVDRGYNTATQTVNWLEKVFVTPLVDDLKPFEAWKIRNSGVYVVENFLDGRILTKGTEVDWPPLIGRI